MLWLLAVPRLLILAASALNDLEVECSSRGYFLLAFEGYGFFSGLIGLINCFENDLFFRFEVEFPLIVSLSTLGGEHLVKTLKGAVLLVERVTEGLSTLLALLGAEFERALAAVVQFQYVIVNSHLNDVVINLLSQSKLAQIVRQGLGGFSPFSTTTLSFGLRARGRIFCHSARVYTLWDRFVFRRLRETVHLLV